MKFERRFIMPALLSAIVLLPSATVLWLASVAARNERVAVRQRLLESFDRQLQVASAAVRQRVEEIDRTCLPLCTGDQAGDVFRRCVEAGVARSVVVYDSSGVRVYPQDPQTRVVNGLNQQAWPEAERLEFVQQDLPTAAQTYAAIAEFETNPDAEAMAWIAHARCLVKAGQHQVAISILRRRFASQAMRSTRDEQGRSIWLSAQIRMIELMQQTGVAEEEWEAPREILRGALEDYKFELPSSQRLFAMQRFAKLFPDTPRFALEDAEIVAERYVHFNQVQRTQRPSSQLEADVVCLSLRYSPIGLLIPDSELEPYVLGFTSDFQTDGIRLKLVTPSEAKASAIASVPIVGISSHLLAIEPERSELFAETSRHQVLLYLSAGVVTMGSLLALAFLTGHFVSRQLRLAQVKADLATLVTHELRTPLASIRLLVDTLLDGTVNDDKRRQEYLKLIAGENERLSRLIDNFLTFSASSRDQQRYTLTPTDPAALIERVVGVMDAKFASVQCDFTTQVAGVLPNIHADADALTIVLVNLLDNALKFTAEEKQIRIAATANDGNVQFLVKDNGVGIARKDATHIFDKFFQADRSLSRSHGGCGLGLSLVQSIVTAHGGTVQLQSVEGHGSEFSFTIPTASGGPASAESNEA